MIADGIVVEAFRPGEDAEEDDGSIIVESKNDTDGVITSNASATNSTTGVGVAVGINIVTYENMAQVGDVRLRRKPDHNGTYMKRSQERSGRYSQ